MKSRKPGARSRPRPRPNRPAIGWREWIRLPDLGVRAIRAKIDTGARTSALHADDIEIRHVGSRRMVAFQVPLDQRSKRAVEVEAELVEKRQVRSSVGTTEIRPVVLMDVELLGKTWTIEVTLTNRDEMGFRMLLGREAVRGRFVVDPGSSFLGGKRLPKGSMK